MSSFLFSEGDSMRKFLKDFVNEEIIKKFCELFSIKPHEIKTLKNSTRCVFQINYDDKSYILKLFDSTDRIKEEIQGEIDFSKACIEAGVSTYDALFSVNEKTIEELPVDEGRLAYGFAYEMIDGIEIEESNDAFQEFTNEMLFDWGKLMGKIHRVSREFTSAGRKFSRLQWDETDTIDYNKYLPESEEKLRDVFKNTISEISSIPKDDGNFGLTHGDLHYGNFFINDTGLSVIDFDSSSYFYYVADIAIPLYSVLPYPRYRRVERKEFAEKYLYNFLKGYYTEYSLPKEDLKKIPLFLKYEDMANFLALYRHWDLNNLSKGQKRVMRRNHYHITSEIPFVDFGNDLDKIISGL